MAYLALYRKYRPNGFNGVIGQDHVVSTLVNQIKTGRLSHAYLFTGTRGTGKTSLAKVFSKAMNCQNNVNGSPCGECEACKALSDPSNIDVIEIDAASNNGVNEIRELRENVQYPPVSCAKKVYIIDEVHMLTPSAFNALLKTLEEPPKHVVFILATTEAHKLPATILSRCMRFDFRLIPTERIASHIAEIFDKEGKAYEKEAVYAIAKAGEGSIRDALSIADTALSFKEGKLTYDDVAEILGSANLDIIYEFTKCVISGNAGEVLETIDRLCAIGKSMGVLTKDVTEVIRALLVAKTCQNANSILGLPQARFNELNSIADSTTEQRLMRILEIFAGVEGELRYTTHPRVVFETSAIKACRPESDYNIDALLARVKELEDKIAKGEFTVKSEKIQEVINEPKVKEIISDKKKLSDFSPQEIKGKLLINLRKNGSEMLWNFAQDVNLELEDNIVKIFVKNSDDEALFNMEENVQKVKDALSEFENVQVQVKIEKQAKDLQGVDDATEKIKKIFGDDIVVIKD